MKFKVIGLCLLCTSISFAKASDKSESDPKLKTSISCKVQKISKIGSQYTVKPKAVVLTPSSSGNGALYFNAELQYEYLGLPGDTEPAAYVNGSANYSMDVTGAGTLAQAVSRYDQNQGSTLAIAPFLDSSPANKGTFKAVLTLITPDSYNNGRVVKIDSDVDCSRQ